ncbi:MAG: RNA-binding S4 domain-containing protein [Bacteroidetes bacterium]|nr:RNA-binding S4 domain-containing protein [Bacteroidota bacterium]
MAKTRSIASEWIGKGKIRLNDSIVKSSKEVKYGDIITVQKNTASFKYEVMGIIDRRVGAPLVKDFLRDITPEEEINKFKEFLANQKTFHSFEDGKRSKKDRRELDDFLDNWD